MNAIQKGDKLPKRQIREAVQAFIKLTAKDQRYVKRLRKLGANNYEIAKALGIPASSLLLD